MKRTVVFILALIMIFSASSISFAADSYTEYFSEEREFSVNDDTYNGSTYFYSDEETGYLYSRNVDTEEIKLIYAQNVTEHYLWGENLFCVVNGKNIVKITVTGQNPLTIFSTEKEIEQLYVNNDLIFYLSDNSIYRYHVESKTNDLMVSDEKISFFYPYSNIAVEYDNGGETPTIKKINGKQRSETTLDQYTYIKNIDQRATVVNSVTVHGKTVPYNNFSDGTYYNKTGKKCSCHIEDKYTCQNGYGCDICMVITDGTNGDAMQCHALGCQTYKNIWGSYINYNNDSTRLINTSARAKEEFQSIPSGSMVRVHTSASSGANHTIIVADVTQTGATIYEANYAGYCIVSMKFFTFSELSSRYYKIEYSYEGNHSFGSGYGYNNSGHWQTCTHGNCNAKQNFATHSFTLEGNYQVCTCGYRVLVSK